MESKDQENADQEALVKKDPYVVTSQGEELKIILDPAQAASGSPSVTVIIQKPGGETAAQAGTGQNDKKGLFGLRYVRDFAGMFAAMIAVFGIFGLGWGAHIAHLAESNRECIPKGSYVLKTDLVGCILGKEAAAKIAVFIERGKHLGNNDAETRIWLDQVLTFVQTIKLPDDTVDENGKPMSKVELNIKNAFRELKVKVQAQKTLGILTGFQAALETQALNQ